MAKRKRLTPARNLEAAPEVKSLSGPAAGLAGGMRPPIADVAGDAATAAALHELSDMVNKARDDRRIIQKLPLGAIVDDHLMRDRLAMAVDLGEMETLIASLKERGQQVAIEVSDLGDGKYGLISGWRRLQALREIAAETPDLDTVLAIVRDPDDAADAYQSMVEENEIRVGLSFYERARIVVQSVNAGVFRADRVALKKLFGAVPKSKRSKINAFIPLVSALDGALPYPAAISEKQGLALSKALTGDEARAEMLRAAFLTDVPESAQAQSERITAFLRPPSAKPKVSNPTPSADVHYIRDGLTMRVQKGGKVLLEGERMTEPHFLQKLKDALNNL